MGLCPTQGRRWVKGGRREEWGTNGDLSGRRPTDHQSLTPIFRGLGATAGVPLGNSGASTGAPAGLKAPARRRQDTRVKGGRENHAQRRWSGQASAQKEVGHTKSRTVAGPSVVRGFLRRLFHGIRTHCRYKKQKAENRPGKHHKENSSKRSAPSQE